MAKRSWVPMDRFALADVRRDHRLTAIQAYLFEQLVKRAAWRGPHAEATTLETLSEFTGLGSSTVKAGLERLAAEGLIVIHEPFRQRRTGLYEVVAYRELVADLAGDNRTEYERKSNDKSTKPAIDEGDVRISLGIEGGGGISFARGSLTRGDRPTVGHFDQLRRQFPGAEEVS